MSTVLQLLRFELRFYVRRLSTWVYLVVLTGMAFFVMNIFGGAISNVSASIAGSDGNVMLNSPFLLLQLISTFAIFGTLIVAAVSGNAGYRDFGENMHALVFTTPVTKAQYVVSRYLGAVIACFIPLAGIAIGMWLGANSPWVIADRFGEDTFGAYLRPYLVIILPNVLFASAIFYSVALVTRSRLPHLLGGAALLLGYLVAGSLAGDLETKWIGALADPFGISAAQVVTEYWTTVEKNTMLIGLEGWLLANRLLWLAVAFLIVLGALWRLEFTQVASEGRKKERREEPVETLRVSTTIDVPAAARSFGLRADLSAFWALLKRSVAEVLLSPYFAAILLGGVLFLIMNAMQLESIFGTPTWPMTWKVIEVLGTTFALFVYILLVLYAGELIWRERDLKMDQVVDATPARSWVVLFSKFVALAAVVVVLMGVVTIAGMLTQAFSGYFDFEPGLYVQKLFGMHLADFLLYAVLALAVHAVVNHKYLGHFLLIVFFVGVDLLPLFGIEHRLWAYGSDLGKPYSDMNRHGWFLGPYFWFKAYWGGVAIVLAVLSNSLWPRGVDQSWRSRLAVGRLRTSGAAVPVLGLGVIVALFGGGTIFYNTNVRNDFQTANEAERLQVRYEQELGQYEGLAQPRITAARLEVDLYPERGTVDARGTFDLVNRTDETIRQVHVLISDAAQVNSIAFGGGAEETFFDEPLGYRIFDLATPLEPQATSTLEFDLSYLRNGFAHSVGTNVVDNGTFVNSGILPSLGYDSRRELVLDRERKKYGLEPKERMRDLDDPVGIQDNYISRDADWVDFEVILSTSDDQIALSPGYPQREWEEDGRRYVHFAMDAPILHFFSFLSARYEVTSDTWNDVAIEVYHHPSHTFNVAGMIESVKKSLEYFTREFSPYQHRQMRILEFPRYSSFAQSFPNTVPYSESIGFIARVREDDIDYPFYVTAHEVAHQWWAHQVIGGNVQGSTVLSETLSQYSAFMVMEHEYGAAQIRKFLKYELDRYLSGRSLERKKEVPLLRVENQPYIHYNKGSVVMYAIRDMIGEEAVNRALSNLLDEWAFKGPPYPTSRALLDALLAETPEEHVTFVRDLFEKIILYENRAIEASAESVGEGRYTVTLAFEAKKLSADELGNEEEVTLDDSIDIGVFDADGEALYLQKHRISAGEHSLVITVEGVPASAGIDPYNKLIDRNPDDNEVSVEIAT